MFEATILQVLNIDFPFGGIAEEIFEIMETLENEASNFLREFSINITNLLFLQFMECLENKCKIR